MKKTNIEDLIAKDLDTFITALQNNNRLTVEEVCTLSAFIAANFMKIIYAKQKSISATEINGVLGIISNILNQWFDNQFSEEDFLSISEKSLQLLQNTSFEQDSKKYFSNIVA